MEDLDSPERVKFYGPRDLASGWLAEQAVTLIQEYSSGREILSLDDALELYNALLFEEHSIIPNSLNQRELEALAQSARDSRKQVASFFSSCDAASFEDLLNEIDFQYAEDLILLLERHSVAQKVGSQALFDALMNARMPLAVMLSDRQFVKRHDRRLRGALLTEARNGELLVRVRMVKDSDPSYFLPLSFDDKDSQKLLSDYIESASPHLNYVQAIAEAKDNEGFGLTPKIRLKAKKRYEALTKELFADDKNTLTNDYYDCRIDPEQREPVLDRIDRDENGTAYARSFSEQYFLSATDPQRVLKNFAFVVGYLDGHGLLTMPSFKSQLGVLRRMFISGKDAYPTGNVFSYVDALTFQGTLFYSEFLRQNSVEVEDAVAWFFREHLVDQFGAVNFYYTASSPSSSFLERCRHIAAEMESLARQFTLHRDEGELDPELLRMTSAPRPWAEIPSLVDRKYLYRGSNRDCDQAIHLLFSDQSRLTYINKELRARSFVKLITENEVPYDSIHHYQKESVDWLISEGLVVVDSGVMEFAQPWQVLVLSDINSREAAAYGHYGADESAAALALAEKGWIVFSSTLLTSAEASYFNYFLNKSEFSDGPDLRNKYAHGTNADPGDVNAHRQSYVQLLRMLVSLVLKIGDDFQISVADRSPSSPEATQQLVEKAK